MIKILHVVSSLSIRSGVMSVLMNYYRNIDKDKIQFEFCYFVDWEDTYEDEINSMGGRVIRIPRPSLSRSFLVELNNFFKQQKDTYLALHIHEVYLTFLFAPIAKRHGVSNIITHSHTTMYSDQLISSLRNRMLCSRLKKHSNHYFACSADAGKFLFGNKAFEEGAVTVINNAINCDRFSYNEDVRKKQRQELSIEQDFVVGHVGRFNKQKNHFFIIKVFKEIVKKNDNAKLILIGEGPLKEKVEYLVESLELKNHVIFLGARTDVNELMQAMDVFLCPSLFEGLGIVLIESQVSGLPCFASDVIPEEVKVTDLLRFLKLNDGPKVWADNILDTRNSERNGYLKEVKDSGFDISMEAKKLQKIYIEMSLKSN